MDREELIHEIVRYIKRKAQLGTNLGYTKSQRLYVNEGLYVTFNAPKAGQTLTGLAYAFKNHHFASQLPTHNIVVSERYTSGSDKVSVRRTRLKFWKTGKVWESLKSIEEERVPEANKDWVTGDADFPEHKPAESRNLYHKMTVNDKDLRRLAFALQELDESGTWEETFFFD